MSYSFPEKAGVKGSLSVLCNLPEKASVGFFMCLIASQKRQE